MHQLTQLKGTDVFCLEVEKDACFIKITDDGIFVYDTCVHNNLGNWQHITLPPSNWQLLGTCDDKVIDFDVEGVVQKTGGITDRSLGGKWYLDYTVDINDLKSFTLQSKDSSFRSLLAANNLYWVNPCPDTKGLDPKAIKNFAELYNQWQSYELKKLTGKLVFIKLLK